ncbi:MAG: hypothetical protein E7148_02060 [Rikenellaceae bacterium]|nr:hypothetical protein [Rikenellaceae bacterium]
MRGKRNYWERIEAVINWANMTINRFARHIGLPRGENLYQIKRGNNGISIDLASRIVDKFPQISKLWLLTGDGEMFVEEGRMGKKIPFYPADPEADITRIEELCVESFLMLPTTDDCDFAMRYNGRAMGNIVPTGSIVALKKIPLDAIIPGEEYVIVSQKIVTLRIVRVVKGANKLRLVAGDNENYDDIVLNSSDIIALYKVKAKIIINN